jgi:hypothetical protein
MAKRRTSSGFRSLYTTPSMCRYSIARRTSAAQNLLRIRFHNVSAVCCVCGTSGSIATVLSSTGSPPPLLSSAKTAAMLRCFGALASPSISRVTLISGSLTYSRLGFDPFCFGFCLLSSLLSRWSAAPLYPRVALATKRDFTLSFMK